MKPRVAILVPTVGRESLKATLQSIAPWDGEQVIVLAQGDRVRAGEIFDEVDPRVWIDGKPSWTFHALADSVGGYGHDSRNFALSNLLDANVTHVATVDDDDVLTPDALDAFADATLSDAPVTVFRCKWGPGHPANGVTLWRQDGLIAYGEIATPMLFHRVGRSRWGMGYGGDYSMAQALAAEFDPASWAWREEVVCVVRPVADLATEADEAA